MGVHKSNARVMLQCRKDILVENMLERLKYTFGAETLY
jgi:hypothetical protein